MRIDKWRYKIFIKWVERNKSIIKIATGITILLVAFLFFPLNGEEEPLVEKNSIEAVELNSEPIASDPIPDKKIVCDISGEINNPGVYELDEGNRLQDLIDMAGGLTEEADINAINRAGFVNDGEKIYIPSTKDGYFVNSRPTNIGSASTEPNKININYADIAELQSIPGVGPVTAEKIIDYRESNGLFSSIEEITNVSGIGEKTYKKMAEYITI